MSTKSGWWLASLALAPAASAGPLVAQRPVPVAPVTTTTQLKLVANAGPQPTGLRAAPYPTSIRVTWNCSSGATGYDLYATPVGGSPVKLTAAPLSAQCIQDLSAATDPRLQSSNPIYVQGYTHAGLPPATQFGYVVRALYPNGYTDSEVLTAKTSLWPAPSGLAASVLGRSATLRWSANAGPSGYVISRTLAGQGAAQQIAQLPGYAASYPDNTLLPPGQHAYVVQAIAGEPSPSVTVTLPAWPAPTVRFQTAGRWVLFQWPPIPGVSGYLVFRELEGEQGFRSVTPTPIPASMSPEYRDSALVVGTHRFYVAAVQGDASPAMTVVSGRPNPGFRSRRGSAIVDFGWSGTGDAAAIALVRASNPAGPFTPIKQDTPRKDWARDEGAQVGGTQYYKVQAIYATQQVPYPILRTFESDVLTVTIAPAPQGPTNFAATTPADHTVYLHWTCAPNATGYQLMKQLGTEPADFIREPGGTLPLTIWSCDYTDGAAWAGWTYTYRVLAIFADGAQASEPSVTVTVTK
jgi:hypothetical protein